jgi:hypothetical protein
MEEMVQREVLRMQVVLEVWVVLREWVVKQMREGWLD